MTAAIDAITAVRAIEFNKALVQFNRTRWNDGDFMAWLEDHAKLAKRLWQTALENRGDTLWAQKWPHSFLCPCCSAGCGWRSSKHPSSVLCVTGSWTFLPTIRSLVPAEGIAPSATTWFAMLVFGWRPQQDGGHGLRSQACSGLGQLRAAGAKMAVN